jgi:amino acid adenylation domain-containing protein
MAANLSILNDPPKVLDGPKLLHRLIRWEEHTEACAVDFTSNGRRQQYSYGEVQSCVTSLVGRIQDSLAKSNTRTDKSRRQHIVPVLIPQSPGLYISQLAVLNSGGAFCPINLDAPKDRVKFVVGDVSADLIITTLEFKDIATWENGPTVIIVDEFPEVQLEKPASRETPREASPDELSYVMYTSGSSGVPKGVAISHLAASQSLLAHKSLIPSFCRFLQFAAPSFDVSVFEIFFPLTMGCTLVGCNRNQLLNDLPGMINQLEVDAAELTPTVVGSLLRKRSNAPGLKLLLTIGEPLTRPIVEEFGGSESKETMLYGMYGPTEAAIHCTIHPKMEAGVKPGNIGVPFETVSTFIAAASTGPEDAGNLEFLPIGELGELILGGPQLAQGYLNREEQNKAAFVQFEGKNYYRTGDKARQLEDGSVEIFGRISAGQVKLRGQRVELGEIEEVVYKHPGVKTVSTAVLGSTLIVFALVGDELLRPEDVMETCAQWLPTFMVPSEIVMLRKFTYLPSGKVDKRKLISDYQKQREGDGSDDTSSTTDSERTIKRALQEILGPFSSSMRLAAAGLDSLVAIRVASKLRLLGFNGINAVAVLQAESLTSLVQLCERSTSNPSHKGTLPSRGKDNKVLNGHAKDVESTMPCTPLQSAMLSETAIDENAYRNWVELRLPDITDTEQVISALKALAYSNPILRTGFAESQDSDGYIQIIWKTFSESQIFQVKEFSYEFDSTKDTSLHHPLRLQVLQTSSGVKLLLHIHHALYDAWSLELLLDDLDTLLAAQPVFERPPFSEIVDGYLDGTLKFDDWSSKEYWKDHLAHLDVRQVPNFHSRESPPKCLLIERMYTSIPTSTVEVAARRLSASPQSLFQAAYALVLGSYLGSQDVCFGSVFSGRTLPIVGIEDIVGPCLATLPVRIDVSTCTTLQDLVQEVNAANRKHLEHSTLPLRDIKSVSGVNPRQLLFDTLLIWQQTLHSYDHVRKNVLLIDAIDNLEFNLTLEIIPGSGNIELKANYQNALFPASQVKILLRQVEQFVRVILEDELALLEDVFNSLDTGVLSIENETPEIRLKGGTLSSPVEKIAAEDPDRPAIDFARSVDETQIDIHRVSYSQLNTIANQMGHHLLEGNILPDELVCICMEKSVDSYASILAVTKVGAGYLPLAPDIPPERLECVLREGKVRMVMAKSDSRSLFELLSDLEVVYVDEIDFSGFSSENISSRSSASNISYCVFTSGTYPGSTFLPIQECLKRNSS